MSAIRNVLLAIALAVVAGFVLLAFAWLRGEDPATGASVRQPEGMSLPTEAGTASDPTSANRASEPVGAPQIDAPVNRLPNPGGPEPHTFPDRPLDVDGEMMPIEQAEQYWAESGNQPLPPDTTEQPTKVRPPGGGAIASFEAGSPALPPEHGAKQTFDEGEPIEGSDIISSVPQLGESGADHVPPETANPGIIHPPPEASDPGISYPAPEDSDPGVVYPAPEDGGGGP